MSLPSIAVVKSWEMLSSSATSLDGVDPLDPKSDDKVRPPSFLALITYRLKVFISFYLLWGKDDSEIFRNKLYKLMNQQPLELLN